MIAIGAIRPLQSVPQIEDTQLSPNGVKGRFEFDRPRTSEHNKLQVLDFHNTKRFAIRQTQRSELYGRDPKLVFERLRNHCFR